MTAETPRQRTDWYAPCEDVADEMAGHAFNVWATLNDGTTDTEVHATFRAQFAPWVQRWMTADTPRGDDGWALTYEERERLLEVAYAYAHPADEDDPRVEWQALRSTVEGFILTRAPQDDRAAQVRALREAAEAIDSGEVEHEDLRQAGVNDIAYRGWSDGSVDSALNSGSVWSDWLCARADALAASPVAQGERGQG